MLYLASILGLDTSYRILNAIQHCEHAKDGSPGTRGLEEGSMTRQDGPREGRFGSGSAAAVRLHYMHREVPR